MFRRLGPQTRKPYELVVFAVLAILFGSSFALQNHKPSEPESLQTLTSRGLNDPAAGKKAVLVLGDSATENNSTGGRNYAARSAPWPSLLTRNPDSPWLLKSNLAQSGHRMKDQLEVWVTTGRKHHQDVDVVAIMIGINDSRKGTTPAELDILLTRLITEVRAEGQDIVVVSPPPNNSFPGLLAPVVETERRVAEREGVQFVDVFYGLGKADGRWRDPRWTVDGVHPTGIGHEKIAELVLDALI